MDAESVRRIEAHLEAFWDEQAIKVDGDSTSIDDLVAAMDSKTAVEALIEVEDIVEMELPVGDVVRPGGYASRDEFIRDLTRTIVKYVEDNKS